MDASDHPLLRSVAAWAAGRPDVVAAVLLGTRRPEEGTGDAIADFDVALRVDDPARFRGEEWLEEIAPVLVAGDHEDGPDGPGRLVFFAGQQRVDFRIRAAGEAPGDEDRHVVLHRRAADAPASAASSVGAPAAIPVGRPAPSAPSTPAPATLGPALPVLGARDVAAWLAHYRALGFATARDPDGSGRAVRDGLVLAVAPDPVDAPGARARVVVEVDDPAGLHAEWAATRGGTTTPPGPCGAVVHVDPAGNVLRLVRRRG